VSLVSAFPEGLWVGVVSHLWQTTIVLGVLALLAGAMRRAPARLLNALWWIGLAKLMVPVQFAAPLILRAISPIANQAAGMTLPSVTVWLGRAAPVLDPAAGAPLGRFLGAGVPGVILAGLWGAGAIWLTVRLVRARGRIAGSGTFGRDGLPSALVPRLDAALDGTGIPVAAIRVIRSSVMPATVGLFRRAIVVPEVLITRLDESELRAVLLHEDAHRRRLDPLQAAVQRVVAVAFYFFPLLWPLLSRLRETSEIACDEAAVERGVSPSVYARALARTVSIGLEPLGLTAALARGTPSFTRRRFDRLAQEGRFAAMRSHRLCLAVATLAMVAVSLLSFALMAEERVGAAGTGNKVTGGKASPVVAAVANAVGRAIASGVSGAVASDAETAESAREVATGEDQAPGDARAAAEGSGREEAGAERAAGDEGGAEERTYTLTLEHMVDPQYPEDAKEDGVEGKLILRLTLHPDGEVGDVAVLEPVEGYPSFSGAAELAAWQWVFRIEGRPEGDVEVIVPVEFKLDDEKTMEMSVTVPDADEKPDAPEPPEPPAAPQADEAPAPPESPESGGSATP
jgi:TonB family protein